MERLKESFWYNVNILANGFKAIYLNLARGEKVFQVEKNIMDLKIDKA